MKIVVGAKIKQYRMRTHVTQEEFAEKIEVSKQSVSKWEKGICCPDIMLLPKIAQLLQCSIDDFFVM